MKRIIPILFLGFLMGCQSVLTDESQKLSFNLSGDMLFEGANTLQASAEGQLQDLASNLQIDPGNIESIGVSTAQISLGDNSTIVESLLLQIVSDKLELTTVGTLSPLPEGNSFELSLAEEIDLKPYLASEGATWVLDLNLSEDFMDVMEADAELSLKIQYSSN
jgi:hypothetical protein